MAREEFKEFDESKEFKETNDSSFSPRTDWTDMGIGLRAIHY